MTTRLITEPLINNKAEVIALMSCNKEIVQPTPEPVRRYLTVFLLTLVTMNVVADIHIIAPLCRSPDTGRVYLCQDQNTTNTSEYYDHHSFRTIITGSSPPPDQDDGFLSSILSRLLLYFRLPKSGSSMKLEHAALVPVHNHTQYDQSSYRVHYSGDDGTAKLLMISPVMVAVRSPKKMFMLPDWLTLPLQTGAKQSYIDKIIEVSRNQPVIAYPVELSEEQISSANTLFYEQLLQWAERLAFRKARLIKEESRYEFAHTDEELQQTIFNALADAFDNLVSQNLPPEVALAALMNNLDYDACRKCVHCPQCGSTSVSCSGTVEEQTAAVSGWQHDQPCEYSQPNRCRTYDPSEYVQEKPRHQYCECGQTLPYGAVDTGGMAHVLSGVRDVHRICRRAIRDLTEDLPNPNHHCWITIASLATHTNILMPVIHSLIEQFGAPNMLIWASAAQQIHPDLAIVTEFLHVNMEPEEPQQQGHSTNQPLAPSHIDQLLQDSDFLSQLPQGYSEQQVMMIANNIPVVENYQEYHELVLSALKLMNSEQQEQGAEVAVASEAIVAQLLPMAGLPEAVLVDLLSRLTFINEETGKKLKTANPIVSMDDERIFGEQWFNILATLQSNSG